MSREIQSTKTRRTLWVLLFLIFVSFVPSWPIVVRAADDPKQIVAEAQKRTDAKSQRYEGLLEVFDAKGKVTSKRWAFERLGSHGQSKSVLRFSAPAEVKGVALLVVNHPDRASDQWMWTPALDRKSTRLNSSHLVISYAVI